MVGQLTYFYTDKAGLAAGMVATVFMITKIIDAFTDIIMGNIIDHTKPGKERYRPWILRMSIPAAVLMLMLFTVPKTGAGMQIAYMLITNLLMTSVIYTAIAIPYASLQVVRTNSSEERGKMGDCVTPREAPTSRPNPGEVRRHPQFSIRSSRPAT